MIELVTRLFARAEPVHSEASPRDAAAIAALHAISFRSGWSDGEFERLLGERNVVAHRATVGGTLQGFILSRIAGDEAEILSVAVAPAGSRPYNLKPTTSGISIDTGWPSIAASASMPPTPQPSTPRPLIIVVCESVPTSESG